MSAQYDAIVIGARCAGSPTAMLLARKGYRVLLVDRASFPSDTLSVTSSTSRASHPSSAGASMLEDPSEIGAIPWKLSQTLCGSASR